MLLAWVTTILAEGSALKWLRTLRSAGLACSIRLT
jgi:hypothetical protein